MFFCVKNTNIKIIICVDILIDKNAFHQVFAHYLARGIDEPARSGAAFRYLLSNQQERFLLSVPTLICNGPKKVIQYFTEEEARNFRDISWSAPALQNLRLH